MTAAFSLNDYPLANHSAPRTGASPRIPRRLARVLSLADFEVAARRHLPRPIFAYVSGGCETDRSLRENRAAFEDYDWVPRVLVDTSRRTLETTLFGHTYPDGGRAGVRQSREQSARVLFYAATARAEACVGWVDASALVIWDGVAHALAARYAAFRELACRARRADFIVECAARFWRARSFELGALAADSAALARHVGGEGHSRSARCAPCA